MKAKGYLKHITKRGRELLARKDMQPAIKLFEKATKASRAHSKLASESLDKYGDHGSHISGVLRDHFPKDVKDKLRQHARDINTHADAAYYARPKGVRNTTMQALAGAVATKTGTGFYGPQANPKGRKKMAKKRRTAKQRAATKKLVAMNKKRRGKKTKTARRKVSARRKTTRKTKKNPAPRVTIKRLENRIKYLNEQLGRPIAPYTKDKSGKFKANIGNLHLAEEYGGVGLYEMATAGGGVNNIAGGIMTKRELDNFISGMMARELVQQTSRGKKNPGRAKSRAANKFSIWTVSGKRTTGLATSNVFTTKAGAQKYCRDFLSQNRSYAIVNSRLTSVGVNRLLQGKA